MSRLSESEKSRLKSSYGPWALVTGASSGLGKAIAEQLASAGLNLVLTARREKVLLKMAMDLGHAHGIQAEVIAADLSQRDGIDKVLRETEGMDLGLFVGSAGFGTSGEFFRSPLQDEVDMLQVNCLAATVMTHHYGKRFMQQGRGGIILMSSLLGFHGVPFAAHYAATKCYIQALVEGLAIELKGSGVDILATAPGPVNTGFADRADMRMGKALTPEEVAIPTLKALGRRSTTMPGFLTKFLRGSLLTLPRWGKIRVMKSVMGGFTKHQRA